MKLSLQMHCESLISVTGRLKSTTDFTDLHVLVFLLNGVINDCLELCLLLLELVHFCHDSFGLFDFTFFTELLSVLVIEVNFGFELVNFQICSILLGGVHFWLINALVVILSALGTVLCSSETSLDLLIHLGHHLSQLHDELVLIFSFETLPVSVIDELLLQIVIMSTLARTNVCFGVWKEVIRAE